MTALVIAIGYSVLGAAFVGVPAGWVLRGMYDRSKRDR